VSELGHTRRLIEQGEFPLVEAGGDSGRFFVPSAAALGGAVVFSQAR